jgi:tetratricopeptide (TPR) repeat protein
MLSNATQVQTILFWQTAEYYAAAVRFRLLENYQGALNQIDREIYNFRSSINWLKKQEDKASALLLLSYLDLLIPYFQTKNFDVELEQWCKAGVEAGKRLNTNPGQLLFHLGEAQYALGRWKEAGESWQLAAATSGDEEPTTYARAVFGLGRLQSNRGDYKAALATLTKAEKLFTDLGDSDAVLAVRSELAAYYLNRRDLDEALRLYLEIDQTHRNYGAIESPDSSLLMLGVVYRQKEAYEEAIRYLSELYHRGEQRFHSSSQATASHHLAWTYLALGQMEKAQRFCGQALALYQDIQDPRGLSDGYEQFGVILFEQGRYEEAIKHFRQSGEMRRLLGNQPGFISSVRREALGYLFDGQYIKAVTFSVKTLILYLRLGLLSRERIKALVTDFLPYLNKAWHARRGNLNKSDS